MTQKFYTKWQAATLADAGCSVSWEYRRFQTALIHELTRYATASGAKVVSSLKGHYDTSCFIERNGRFVYISHSSTFSRTGSGVKIELGRLSSNRSGYIQQNIRQASLCPAITAIRQ